MENDNSTHVPKNAADAAADDAGAAAAHSPAGISPQLQRASDAAVQQHLDESAPKRGRGRPPIHGRYSQHGTASVPLEAVGAGPAAAPAAEIPANVYPLGWQPEAPAFDEKAAAAMVEVGISGLNYLGAFIVRIIGGREVPDKEVIDAAVANCQVSEDAKKHLRDGGLACAKKYAVQMQYAPEAQLGLGLAMWGLGMAGQVKELKTQGKELRTAA